MGVVVQICIIHCENCSFQTNSTYADLRKAVESILRWIEISKTKSKHSFEQFFENENFDFFTENVKLKMHVKTLYTG